MKFNMAADAENYSPSTNTGYFSLKNDGDSARVRICYENINDVEGHCVHRVKTNNGFKYVECLREYNDPLDMCPLCSSDNMEDRKLLSKIWIPIYKLDDNEIVLWERGKQFWQKEFYPLMVEKGEPFCANVFTIVRHGEANNMETTYEFISEGCDDTTLDDFEDIPSPTGTLVLEKTFEELESFLKTRSFDGEQKNSDTSDFPRRRTSTSNDVDSLPRRRGTSRPNIT